MIDDDGPPLHDLLEALEADLPRELRGALAPRLWWEERGGFIHLPDCPDCPERLRATRGAHADLRPEVQLHASLAELLLRDSLDAAVRALSP